MRVIIRFYLKNIYSKIKSNTLVESPFFLQKKWNLNLIKLNQIYTLIIHSYLLLVEGHFGGIKH